MTEKENGPSDSESSENGHPTGRSVVPDEDEQGQRGFHEIRQIDNTGVTLISEELDELEPDTPQENGGGPENNNQE